MTTHFFKTQSTCFTCKKVQILTKKAVADADGNHMHGKEEVEKGNEAKEAKESKERAVKAVSCVLGGPMPPLSAFTDADARAATLLARASSAVVFADARAAALLALASDAGVLKRCPSRRIACFCFLCGCARRCIFLALVMLFASRPTSITTQLLSCCLGMRYCASHGIFCLLIHT